MRIGENLPIFDFYFYFIEICWKNKEYDKFEMVTDI